MLLKMSKLEKKSSLVKNHLEKENFCFVNWFLKGLLFGIGKRKNLNKANLF
jgi:hypothetical protein